MTSRLGSIIKPPAASELWERLSLTAFVGDNYNGAVLFPKLSLRGQPQI
jgi:hypothetical protein